MSKRLAAGVLQGVLIFYVPHELVYHQIADTHLIRLVCAGRLSYGFRKCNYYGGRQKHWHTYSSNPPLPYPHTSPFSTAKQNLSINLHPLKIIKSINLLSKNNQAKVLITTLLHIKKPSILHGVPIFHGPRESLNA